MNIIIDYLSQNGVMNPAQLAMSAFSGQHFEDVLDVLDVLDCLMMHG